MINDKEHCESEVEQLRRLVLEARHFARYMENPQFIGKNKAMAQSWLLRVAQVVAVVPWDCPKCGHLNDPDDRRCVGRGHWVYCGEDRPEKPTVRASE